MSLATAFPDPPGWQQIVNESQFNIINASVTAWQGSGGTPSITWALISAAIIFVPGVMIYVRTQKTIPASMAILLVTVFMNFYGLLSAWVYVPAYLVVVLGIALQLAPIWYKK